MFSRCSIALCLTFLCGCPAATSEDAGAPDALPAPDAAPADANEVVTPDVGFMDAAEVDAGFADAAAPDAEPIDGGTEEPRVIDVVVAYRATAKMPLLAELYVTQSSTIRAKVHGALAGGPPIDGKGDPNTSGVGRYRWTNNGNGIVYAAEQDNFDTSELYFAPLLDHVPTGTTSRLSLANGGSEVREHFPAPNSNWLLFSQTEAGIRGTKLWAVQSELGEVPFQIGQGLVIRQAWAPIREQLAFQDIRATSRDLWFVDLDEPVNSLQRINSGANIGFGSGPVWRRDGNELIYTADDDRERVFEAYRVSVGPQGPGTPERIHPSISATADVSNSVPLAYSDDSNLIGYAATTVTPGVNDLFTVDVSQGSLQSPVQITDVFPMGAQGVQRFHFSPDSQHILYVADHDTARVQELYVASSTSAGRRRVHTALSAPASITRERWLARGSLIIYQVSSQGSLRTFVASFTNGLLGTPVEIGADPGRFDARYEVSPQGRYMVVATGRNPSRLSLVDLSMTPPAVTELASASNSEWCWGPEDELAVVADPAGTGTFELYLVEDLEQPSLFLISGPLVAEGRVLDCRFPPAEPDEE